jgi:hypothetical protein
MVQSGARNFSGLTRNFDLEGPGEKFFSDLDDGEDDDDNLVLDGSGDEMTCLITY